ncbi:MAG: DUF1287 domain-containing protein [Candidatus Kapaibacterium sp.]
MKTQTLQPLRICTAFAMMLCGLFFTACAQTSGDFSSPQLMSFSDTATFPSDSARLLIQALQVQFDSTRFYDPTYVKIDYPGGDVPLSTGVCADVVVRSFRSLGVDLQVQMHEDMGKNFGKYPKNWGLSKPDKNIDHRRVANQMVFFERKGKGLEVADSGGHDPKSFQPGDVVAWMLPGNLYHIGIVTHIRSPYSDNLVIAHNIGRGAELHDCLFTWKIIGHYRWFGGGSV